MSTYNSYSKEDEVSQRIVQLHLSVTCSEEVQSCADDGLWEMTIPITLETDKHFQPQSQLVQRPSWSRSRISES